MSRRLQEWDNDASKFQSVLGNLNIINTEKYNGMACYCSIFVSTDLAATKYSAHSDTHGDSVRKVTFLLQFFVFFWFVSIHCHSRCLAVSTHLFSLQYHLTSPFSHHTWRLLKKGTFPLKKKKIAVFMFLLFCMTLMFL